MRYYFIQPIYLPLFFLYLLIYPHLVSAIKTQPSDIDYYIHSAPSFSIIFSENFLENDKKDFIHIYKKISYYDDLYKEVFTKKLKEKPIYIFTSPRNQISNAITSSIPFLRVLFFPTGVEKMNRMATISWEDTVIAHEMAHIFQLGQISDHLKHLGLIFKNSEVVFLPIPVFLSVNLVMSLFLLEGHAVLNESLFAPGGRLYSGSIRALVFSQIKNKFKTTTQFIKDYLVNHTEDTFSINQQYVHGGYFFSSLLRKYDLKKINSIFKKHAEYFIIPFSFISIKSTFESIFDNSFESLVHYYIQTYLPLAVQQKQSSETSLFHSHICPPFNKKGNEIFFLNSDLKSTPILRTFNTLNGKWQKRKKVFSKGKIFKIKNQYYVSSSDKISTTERAYGLFSEGMYLLKKYKSQYVQDIHENQVLSIDTTNNLNGFHLLLNGRFYDKVHSPALFGPEGHIYYFKQKEDQRIMYKNKVPLFQFKGFYGKPVEINKNGDIYFIASSLFGSSLFVWNSNEGIYRVSPSDTIIEAIQGPHGNFLVCEVTPDFYTYKIIHPTILLEKPAFYDYSFEKVSHNLSTVSALSNIKKAQIHFIEENQSISDSNYLQQLKEIDKMQGEPDDSTLESVGKTHIPSHVHNSSLSKHTTDLHHNIPYSNYNPFWQIRFNGLELGLSQDPITGYNGLVSIALRDPLEYNAIQFAYQKSLKAENWLIQSKYTNRAYRLYWDIQHIYKEGFENFSGARTYAYIHEFSQGFVFPIVKRGYWKSSLYTKSAVSHVEFSKIPGQFWYFSIEPSLILKYERKYSKNYDFHRQFFTQTSLQYNFKFSSNDSNFRLKTQSYYTMNMGWEFYTTPFFTYKTALKPKSIPFRYFKPLGVFSHAELLNSLRFFLRERVFEETNDYLSTGMQFQKLIDTPLYFARFPFSLINLAPVFNGKYIQFLNNNKKERSHFLEWTFGLKIGVLFHHKIKAKIHLYYGYSYPLDAHSLNDITSSTVKTAKKTKSNSQGNSHFGLRLTSDF